ncbi:OmpP1/FadL family transporter [Pseudomonas oryzae]|uniref:Long-chain fatty acid transport protein n=1 Tax=Pseudomonas oryzae TaxID=1392877 RepID=A0A1H1VE17_9PSED|nr:outer membrane protein transport protein [Pseudomonas oryzae]SDS82691.1 long-chain fatty acid transport protein [Pseudomonas oryzae]
MSFHKPLLAALLLGSAAISPLALATNGYFAHGYGIKSLGMAGVGFALPQDALAAASNPAGTALVGDRLDLGVTWFRPDRSVAISGSPVPGANGRYDGNDTEAFLIPEFGYTRQLDERLAFGLAVYANGGMNTDYGRNPFAAYGSHGDAGVDLAQVFVTPSLAWRISERQTIGVALNYAYQRFEARGLSRFDDAMTSEAPGKVSDNGHDHSDGWGLRLGWNGRLSDSLTLGVAWSSKIRTGKFERYEGLFADHGSFDIPENYGIGLAWQASDRLTLAADVQQIDYSDVKAISNPVSVLFDGHRLGSEDGPNFGWEDIRVYKLGASYAVSPQLTLRGGYSWADQALDKGETFFNTLAPGVVREHLTFGATWAPVADHEISLFYAHAFSEELKGSDSIPQAFGGGEVDLKMQQDSFGIAYAWKL